MSGPGGEGRYTKVGSVAGVVSAIVAIIALLVVFWPPGETPPTAQPLPAPAPTVAATSPSTNSAVVAPTAGELLDPSTGAGGAGPQAATYLDDLEVTRDSDPYDGRGVAQVNGTSYPHSQGAKFCASQYERKWTYVLGRKYDYLRGVVGLSDDSIAAARIRFEVIADGRPAFSKELQVGDSAELDLPVSDVLRVDLITTLLTKEGRCGSLATGQWADVRAETST